MNARIDVTAGEDESDAAPLGRGSLPASSPAAGTAPVGSTRSLPRSRRKRTASLISSSDTSSRSVRFRRKIGNVRAPGARLRIPSAMVGGGGMLTRSPFRKESHVSLALSASTP